jgi:excisionase family DNA binding protein
LAQNYVSQKGADSVAAPMIYTIAQACAIACAGRSAIYQAIAAKQLRAVKRGRRTLILADDLREWVNRLPEATITAGPEVRL